MDQDQRPHYTELLALGLGGRVLLTVAVQDGG